MKILLNMKDTKGISVSHIIDSSTLSAFGVPSEMSESRKRYLLEDWILCFGNYRHHTILTLVSWKLIHDEDITERPLNNG